MSLEAMHFPMKRVAIRVVPRMPLQDGSVRWHPGLSWFFGVGVMLAVVFTVLLCLWAGQVVGRKLTAPNGKLALPSKSQTLKLDPSFTQGYLAGIQAGRNAADAYPTRLKNDEIGMHVNASLAGEESALNKFGEAYGAGYKKGAVAGMRQRMSERFGNEVAQHVPTQRIVVVDPAADRAMLARMNDPSKNKIVMPKSVTDIDGNVAVTVSDDADESEDAASNNPIRRIVMPDGTVEYTNL